MKWLKRRGGAFGGGRERKLDPSPDEMRRPPLSADLRENENRLRDRFSHCSDIVFRSVAATERQTLLIVFIDGLVDKQMLDEAVLKPILANKLPEEEREKRPAGRWIKNEIVALSQTRLVSDLHEAVQALLNSSVVILADGETAGLAASLSGAKTRGIEEPASEAVLRGPREGFTESIRTNTSMLRRKIKSARLKMESLTVGDVTQTEIVISYIDGIARQSIIDEVRERVSRIRTDSILESGYIEEFIEEETYSPFPTVQNTERPDIVASSLLEGKIAVLTDGTPFVLIVPFTFWAGLQAAEDYYNPTLYSSAVRFIRLIFTFVSLFLPSLFVAIVNFHAQMLPTSLALNFASAREASPFPTVFETFLMEALFEGLREAGIRLPKQIGSAISIVGALVIGQAAVQAGIVSAPIVIVVAGTGIASFTIARLNLGQPLRLLRFILLILAGTLGLYGIVLGTLALLMHLASLRSFGVPYFSPLAPLSVPGLKDALWRSPRWKMHVRPEAATDQNSVRTPKGQQPSPKR